MLELKHIFKKIDEKMILNDISIVFPDKGMIGIQGESGCGKSTLLYIIGMLDNSFEGEILYNGETIQDKEEFIRQHVSYVMQNKDYISALNIKENIAIASQVGKKTYHAFQIKKLAQRLHIQTLLYRYPHQLSGGQLKRVSLAKALLKDSSYILCDEPTGALHQSQAHDVMKILKRISHDRLVIVVSHDPQLLNIYCDSVLTLSQKQLHGDIALQQFERHTQTKKKNYSLLIYPIRQLLYQRNKLMFLFLFQWILILAFFIMTTSMNGLLEAIHEDEIHSVTSTMFTIENKDNTPFSSLPSIAHSIVTYQYHIDSLIINSKQKTIDTQILFMPKNTQHILLQQGRYPQQDNEIIVSSLIDQELKDQSLQLNYQDYDKDVKIVGVLKPSLFQEKCIYLSQSITEDIPFLKDEYTLLIETNQKNVRSLYQSLSHHYIAYSDVLERIQSYQSILSLARMVGYVFIGMSLFISLLLIRIVESILYHERKHDIAYLLSLGLDKKRLIMMSLMESFILGIVIAGGGCFISAIAYFYMNEVYDLKSSFFFHLQLNKVWISSYDLYFIIICIYVLMMVIGAFIPMKKLMKVNMIDVLREE